VKELASLREQAPKTVLPAVLVRTGVAYGSVVRPSAVGDVVVIYGATGVVLVDLPAEPREHHLGRPVVAHEPDAATVKKIDAALDAGRPGSLSVDLAAVTPFQAEVLRKVAEIPKGEVRPYSWVAREVGRPKAVRAVGTAVASNPIPLIVPCHRVVRSDGHIGNYSLGGPHNKRTLLAAEGLQPDAIEAAASRGVRYLGSDTTRIYCLPTCRDAKRITAKHAVELRSTLEAEAAGFRPCLRCRPAA
jgi:O-6-methylguanine DNA methyltransferase